MGLSKRVALYCRVSTQKQNNENQKLMLEKYAKDNGFEYDLFEEKESSRKTRPIKAQLMSRLRNHEYGMLVIWRLDRYARSSVELILGIEEIIKLGISFVSLNENLDFSTAVGKLHLAVLSAFAEFERSLISERTREGLRRVKHQGKTLGRPIGSKDKKGRNKSGYYLKEALKRKRRAEDMGVFKPLEQYISK